MAYTGQKTKVYVEAMPLAQDRMSGVGHLTLELVRALARRKELDVRLVVPLWKRDNILRHGIKNTSVKIFPLPARIISILTRLRLLPPVDVFLGAGVYVFPNYRNWPLLFSKSVTFCHDASFMLHPETVSPRNLKYLLGNIKLWFKRADHVVTLTDASKQEILQTMDIAETKISVMPCGVDREVFNARPATEIAEIKKKNKITTEKYILYVGNMEPRKNVNRLIAAYQALPKAIQKEYGLVLIGGGGWLNEDTMQLIDKLTHEGVNITHPKHYVVDEDLPAIYSGASLLVLPALYEGFGIPPIEAMACGIPTAVSDIPALTEVAAGSALLFDPYSVESIAAAIQTGLTDQKLRQRLVRDGKKRAAHYSWDQSATLVTEIIEEVKRA